LIRCISNNLQNETTASGIRRRRLRLLHRISLPAWADHGQWG